ncbi:hypothetical protein OG785_29205 [Streptomyces sp. NBC_00006]|uniref:hypothetical protein n=1 Tax=unclassified Streptomyces TaxID=2593676 RepID=UPI00225AD88A|nr:MULTISPECIES: hypothetical protein [unclassified Streptomyces]MCX4833638.1 hypothetical protein [Streptomyces sp. NBC_01016]MCX5534620.1 hypothetical protein [Streptomyces sp. NBC_00006]
MQQSAVPELAHTTTRPIHWLATAAALAAVVAVSGFLKPDSATAAQADQESPASKPAAVAPPDPAAVHFPLDCGPVKTAVVKKAAGDLDGDGRPETVAVVRCDAGVGTPPSGIYVVTQPAGAKPRVVATLVTPKDNYSATMLAIQDGSVLADLDGYSSDAVPRYRPDVHEKAKWQWKGGAFVRSTPSEARAA